MPVTDGFSTVSVYGEALLSEGPKLPSPAYVAVSWWGPYVSARLMEPWPLPSSVALPSWVDPSKKVALPVGAPVAGATALIAAVMVTDPPAGAGFAEVLNPVADCAGETVRDDAPVVLPVYTDEPLYAAVMV